MGYTYTSRDGHRVQIDVAAAFDRLAAAFRTAWGLDLGVTDGTRTRDEQAALYQAYLNGGTLAAAPGYSNHEEDGPRGPRALDVHDSGDDPGVTRYGTPRANWLRANASDYGFDPAGYSFSQTEPWHIEFAGSLDGSSVALEANQRRAGSNGVRARRAPSTSAEVVDGSFIAEGEVGTFVGYVVGDSVDGENRWAKGAYSGLFFWLGGLTPQNVDGLPMLDAPQPAMRTDQRRADTDGVKGRADATTTAAQTTFLGPAEVGDFNGWKHGQAVDGEDRWLRGSYSGAWFWLGGLSPRTVDGLAEVKGGTTPPVTPPSDGRVIYPQPTAPTYPGATRAAHSSKCDPRKAGASPKVLVMHWWGNDHAPADEWAYFIGWQSPLGSSPTWQSNNDGSMWEVVPPDGFRPWTTGQLDHWAVTIEAQPGFTAAQYESWARTLVWAHERYGIPLQLAVITGTGTTPVVEQGGITAHKLTPAGRESGTKCPGDDMDLDRILRRALELTAPPVDPKPDPGAVLTPEAAGFWQWLFEAIKRWFGGAK